MRLPMNVRRIATLTMVCSALVAGGVAPALAHNHDRHDNKPGHHQLNQQYEHKHWWGYLYATIQALTQGLATLGGRMTSLYDALSLRVDGLAATVAAQANTSLADSITKLTSEVGKLTSDLTLLSAKLDQSVLGLNTKIDQSVAGLNQRITDVNTSITNLLNAKIESLTGTIEGLAGRVAKLEAGGVAGSGLSVVDLNGQKLGDFIGYDPSSWLPLVAISKDGHSFVLRVHPLRLTGDVLYFDDGNCGLNNPGVTVYVDPIIDVGDQTWPLAAAGVKTQAGQVIAYVTSPNIPRQEFPVSSALINGGACEPAGPTANAIPVAAVVQLSAATPYSVK